jgi:hypothetical protein
MGINPCQHETTDSQIRVREIGRQAIVMNEQRRVFTVTKVDGCVIVGAPACDWAISQTEAGDVFIELKGVDVAHAIEQLEATICYWKDKNYLKGRVGALVVCSQYPKVSTFVQRARLRFLKKFNAPLQVVSRNLSFSFADLLSLQQ